MSNYVQRFLLENLDIRGAVVHLDSVWQEMVSGRNYPQSVTQLLGEMSAVTLLLGENLKQTGRLIIQLTGNGPISMLVMDCTDSLHLRGMAKCEQSIEVQSVPDLLGYGHLVLTLDMPSMRESYQSIVRLMAKQLLKFLNITSGNPINCHRVYFWLQLTMPFLVYCYKNCQMPTYRIPMAGFVPRL